MFGFFPKKALGSNRNAGAGGVFQTVGLLWYILRLVVAETEARSVWKR